MPSLQALGPFAHAYANAMGYTLASPGNLGLVLPYQVAKTIFADDRAFAPAFGRGGDWGDVVSGEFRIAALGAEWAVRGACGRNPANVVRLADGIVTVGDRKLRVLDNAVETVP